MLNGIGKLRAYARAAGRAEDDIAISAFGLSGKPEALQPFRDAGVGRAIIALPAGTQDDVMRRLDRYAELI